MHSKKFYDHWFSSYCPKIVIRLGLTRLKSTFAETSYDYVSRGSLSIGEIKLSGKAARGGLIFVQCPRAQAYSSVGYKRCCKFLQFTTKFYRRAVLIPPGFHFKNHYRSYRSCTIPSVNIFLEFASGLTPFLARELHLYAS